MNSSIPVQYNFHFARECRIANASPSIVRNSAETIAEIMSDLDQEADNRTTLPMSLNRRNAALLAYDQWRYLLHSVDGLGA